MTLALQAYIKGKASYITETKLIRCEQNAIFTLKKSENINRVFEISESVLWAVRPTAAARMWQIKVEERKMIHIEVRNHPLQKGSFSIPTNHRDSLDVYTYHIVHMKPIKIVNMRIF